MDYNFENILKLLVTSTGLISLILKFFDSISKKNKKKNLETDVRLLNKMAKSVTDENLINIINIKRNHVYKEFLKIENKSINWFDTFYALVLFIGFSWWSIHLYEVNKGFSPSIIFTSLISFVGLSLLIDTEWRSKKDKQIILKIVLKDNIKLTLMLLGPSIITGLLLTKYAEGFSFWYIVTSLFIMLGLKSLYESISIEK